MKIMLNGQSIEVQSAMSIHQLITDFVDITGAYAVALNRNFVAKFQYANVMLQEGDSVELIQPMQGG